MSCIVWNPNFHDRVNKSPPIFSALNQISPVQTLYVISWRYTLILPSHLRLSLLCGLFPAGLPIKTLYATLLSPTGATRPANLFFISHQNNICREVRIMHFLVRPSPTVPCHLFPLGPNRHVLQAFICARCKTVRYGKGWQRGMRYSSELIQDLVTEIQLRLSVTRLSASFC